MIGRIVEIGGDNGKGINSGKKLGSENLEVTIRRTDYDRS